MSEVIKLNESYCVPKNECQEGSLIGQCLCSFKSKVYVISIFSIKTAAGLSVMSVA